MKILRHLPNALTCANLLCGCVGIILVFHEQTIAGAWMVWIACIFDFFDGFTARLLNAGSPIGKELDSLADMVSFGVLPAMVMFQLINIISASTILPYASFLLAIFSALRLARFNIDENQKESFIGLPTPANAIFITALPFLKSPWDMLISNDILLVGITLIFSFLLVAPIPLFALKMKNLQWANNRAQFTFIALSVLLLAIWQTAALPFVILLYILVSLLKNWIKF